MCAMLPDIIRGGKYMYAEEGKKNYGNQFQN